MFRRSWMALVVSAALIGLIVLLAWAYDRHVMIAWVGGSDLEIEFAVVEDGTGNPISGAVVEVQPDADEKEKEFRLLTDREGTARRDCRSMVTGTRSALGFTDTFGIDLPWWRYRAVADGFETNPWSNVRSPGRPRQVQRLESGKYKLVIQISLQPSARK